MCIRDRAKVMRINVHNSSDSGLQYHPVYEYYAAGEYYTSEGAYLSGRVPEVGETIWIKYNPDKPKQSYIPGYDNKVYKILTIVFGLIGAVPILVCIGIADVYKRQIPNRYCSARPISWSRAVQ